MRIMRGKFKGYAIVYAKDGRVKVDDLDALDPEFRKIIEQEIEKHGRYTYDSSQKRAS